MNGSIFAFFIIIYQKIFNKKMTAAAAKLILLSLISFSVLVQGRDDDDNPFE